MEVWKKSPLFHGMTEQEIGHLLVQEQCKKKTIRKRNICLFRGDVPKSLFLLIQGKVTISQSTMSGRRILLTDITRSGDLFGEVYLFIGKEAYDMDAQAVEDSEVLEIAGEIPKVLWQNMLEIFAKRHI